MKLIAMKEEDLHKMEDFIKEFLDVSNHPSMGEFPSEIRESCKRIIVALANAGVKPISIDVAFTLWRRHSQGIFANWLNVPEEHGRICNCLIPELLYMEVF